MNLNKVMIAGNLTRDPELRYTPSGTAVCNFTIATNRTWMQGETKKEEATFIRCTAWAKTAENVAQYLAKGAGACVEGRLHLNQWEKDGEKRQTLEVIAEQVHFLTKKNSSGGGHDEPPPPTDDDIPF